MCNLLGAVQLALNLLEGSLRVVHLLVDLLVEAEVIPNKFTIRHEEQSRHRRSVLSNSMPTS